MASGGDADPGDCCIITAAHGFTEQHKAIARMTRLRDVSASVVARLCARVRVYRALASARRQTRQALTRGEFRRILVVCYGNICRSPVAAACLRRELPSHIEIQSAGFHKSAGRSTPAWFRDLAHEAGVAISGHQSRTIHNDDIRWADIIVIMDRHNWHAVASLGAAPEKIVWLGALGSDASEIADPYGRNIDAGREILRQLISCSSKLAALVR